MFKNPTIVASEESKMQINKNSSVVSVVPSKAVGKKKFNLSNSIIKTPLSSNQSYKPVVERRSGLQDVDEDYLRQNVFAKPFYRTQNSQDGDVVTGASKTDPGKQLAKQAENEANNLRLRGGAGQNATQPRIQDQLQQQQQIQQSQIQNPNTAQTNNEETKENQKSQAQQNENPQKQEESHSQLKASPKRIQQVYLPVVGKAEMCTTCPNCRATIYLVRGGVNFFQSNQCGETKGPTSLIAK